MSRSTTGGRAGISGAPRVDDEAPYRASGNYGLLDQIAAVTWCTPTSLPSRGDPGRINIAGSRRRPAVHNLTASTAREGHLPRAIIESSGGGAAGGSSRSRSRRRAVRGGKGSGAIGSSARSPGRRSSLPYCHRTLDRRPATGFRRVPFPVVVDATRCRRRSGSFARAGRTTCPRSPAAMQTREARPSAHDTRAGVRTSGQTAVWRGGRRVPEALSGFGHHSARVAQNLSARDLARTTLATWVSDRARLRRRGLHLLLESRAARTGCRRYGAFHTSEVPYVLNTLDHTAGR